MQLMLLEGEGGLINSCSKLIKSQIELFSNRKVLTGRKKRMRGILENGH